jgi:hypothetical protein
VASTRLDWTREEIILAMDAYVTCGALGGGGIPGKGSDLVVGLSDLLHRLSAYPPSQQGERYRNPEGVYLKLTNLRAIETEGRHGMNAFSQLDAAVWREYIDDLESLHREAEALRRRFAERAVDVASQDASVGDVPIERHNTEWYIAHPSGEPSQRERAEQALVVRYATYMAERGTEVIRRQYRPAGEICPIYCDAWVPVLTLLIEAKNSDSRDNIRSAIGQLYDYRRFHESPPMLAVLLPYQPLGDRAALLKSVHVEAIWPHGHTFRATNRRCVGAHAR